MPGPIAWTTAFASISEYQGNELHESAVYCTRYNAGFEFFVFNKRRWRSG